MQHFEPAPLLPYWQNMIAAGRVKPLHALDFSQVKTSDTVFLLGSGPSVNAMSLLDWVEVRKCDSIGMNMWPAHPFVPTLYEAEAPYESQYLYELWKQRADEYSRIPFIVFDCQQAAIDLDRVPIGMVKQMYVARTFFIPGDSVTKESYARSLRAMRESGFFAPSNRIACLARRRTSGVLNLVLAIKMGYRNIVLVGYDMLNEAYFHPFATHAKPREPYSNEDATQGIPVSLVIEAIIEEVARPMGIDVRVSSKSTKLYPFLRMWER